MIALLTTLAGCTADPGKDKAPALQALSRFPPQIESEALILHRLPATCPEQAVCREVRSTIAALRQWLGLMDDPPAMPLVVLAQDDPQAAPWAGDLERNHGCTGCTCSDTGLVLVIGDPCDARFWTVLRHETVHHVLHCVTRGRSLPFWFDEGAATLFEPGVDEHLKPLPNPDRLALIRYLCKTRSSLGLSRLIQKTQQPYASGLSYAEVWAITAYLHDTDRSPAPFVQAIRDGQNPMTAFRTAFPDLAVPSDLEQRVRQWLLSL